MLSVCLGPFDPCRAHGAMSICGGGLEAKLTSRCVCVQGPVELFNSLLMSQAKRHTESGGSHVELDIYLHCEARHVSNISEQATRDQPQRAHTGHHPRRGDPGDGCGRGTDVDELDRDIEVGFHFKENRLCGAVVSFWMFSFMFCASRLA